MAVLLGGEGPPTLPLAGAAEDTGRLATDEADDEELLPDSSDPFVPNVIFSPLKKVYEPW